MDIDEFDRVALRNDLPDEGLEAGDIATVVEKIPATESETNKPGVALEVFNAVGETKSVIFDSEDDIRPLREDEVLNARQTG